MHFPDPFRNHARAGALCRKGRTLLPTILSALAALFAFGVVIYFIIGPAEGYFHADCTDSILWAQASYDSGKVFDETFNYAALLPFGASVWLIPLIHFFGVSMTAHVAGMVIFALLFALAIFSLCRCMEWSYQDSFLCVALMLLCLSSSDKLREIMWNHVIYYSLGILFYVSLLALAISTGKRLEGKKPSLPALLLLALLLVYVILIATDGFQMIVLSVLPCMVAVFGERFFDRETRLLSKKNLPAGMILAMTVAGIAIGLSVLGGLLDGIVSNYANGYSSFSKPEDWAGNLDKTVLHWFTLIGMKVSNGDALMKGDSLVNLLRICVGLILFFVPLILLCCYQKIQSRYTKMLAVGHVFLLAFLLFGCVCGRLAAANWRLTPLLGSSILTTFAAVREVLLARKKEKAPVAARLGSCVLAVLIALSVLNWNVIRKMPADYGRDNDLHALTERLEAEGLTYGYATFWRSQSITLLSDSKVKTREILVNASGITTDHYQSSEKWYEDQPGQSEYFVLLSRSEYNTLAQSTYWRALNQHCYVRSFTERGYYVFVFSENIWEERELLPEPEDPEPEEPDDGDEEG